MCNYDEDDEQSGIAAVSSSLLFLSSTGCLDHMLKSSDSSLDKTLWPQTETFPNGALHAFTCVSVRVGVSHDAPPT